MKTFVMLIAATTFATGCKKKEPPAATMGSGSGVTMAANGSTAGNAAAPKPLTADDRSSAFHDCWAHWAASKWDDLKDCYAKDAVWEAPGSKMAPINGAPAIVELDTVVPRGVPERDGRFAARARERQEDRRGRAD